MIEIVIERWTNVPKEKLTFVGQFGTRGIAFKWERTLTPVPTISRRRQSSSAGVNSVEGLRE